MNVFYAGQVLIHETDESNLSFCIYYLIKIVLFCLAVSVDWQRVFCLQALFPPTTRPSVQKPGLQKSMETVEHNYKQNAMLCLSFF